MLKSLDEALQFLDDLRNKNVVSNTSWTVYQTLIHCAQTIEYSIDGYPESKPRWFQNTIGKIVFSIFKRRGYMQHNLAAPVPGSPVLVTQGTVQQGVERLKEAIQRFKAYNGVLKPHLFFGELSKVEYDQYFAMHIVDHLKGMNID